MKRVPIHGRGLIVFALLSIGLVLWIMLLGNKASSYQLVVAAITTWFFALFWVKYSDHPRDVMEADIIYLAVTGLYVVLPYFLAAFVPSIGEPEYLSWRSLNCVVIAMLALTIGLLTPFGKRFAALFPKVDDPWIPERTTFITTILLIIGAVLLFLLFWLVGTNAYLADYGLAYEAEAGKGPLIFGVYLLELAMFVYYISKVKRDRSEPWIVYLAYAIFTLLVFRVGRRRIAVETGIGLLALRHFCYKAVKLRTLLILFALCLPLLALVGHARAFLSQGLSGMADYARYQFSLSDTPDALTDTMTVPLSLMVTTREIPDSQPYRWGSTIPDAIVNLIPQAIYPSRPPTAGQWMASTYNPSAAAHGAGFGYSLLAEGYLNFGYVGVFLFICVESIYVRALVEFRRSHPHSQGRILLYAVLMTLSITLVRTDVGGLLKSFTLFLPAFFVAMWLGQTPPVVFRRTVRPFELARFPTDRQGSAPKVHRDVSSSPCQTGRR